MEIWEQTKSWRKHVTEQLSVLNSSKYEKRCFCNWQKGLSLLYDPFCVPVSERIGRKTLNSMLHPTDATVYPLCFIFTVDWNVPLVIRCLTRETVVLPFHFLELAVGKCPNPFFKLYFCWPWLISPESFNSLRKDAETVLSICKSDKFTLRPTNKRSSCCWLSIPRKRAFEVDSWHRCWSQRESLWLCVTPGDTATTVCAHGTPRKSAAVLVLFPPTLTHFAVSCYTATTLSNGVRDLINGVNCRFSGDFFDAE